MYTGICNICSRDLSTGALYTAECSHKFHYNCVYDHVRNAKHFCPTCRSLWTQLPSPFPPPSTNLVVPPSFNYPIVPPPWATYNDDEPLPSSATSSSQTSQQGGAMTVKALPEYPALSKSDHSDSFPVLISIRAPLLSSGAADMPNARAPLDLVAVLDVSGSMFGHKLSLLKQAVSFVIKNLGPRDRLSIITFSTESHRLTPLRRMTEAGQTDTLGVVNSIQTEGSTNIIAGLKMAVKVLEQRREKNPVTSIILLSDGEDTDNYDFISCLSQLPQSIRSNAAGSNQIQAPGDIFQVYTFGFGADHDATALHAISDGSGGTFSYIEAVEVIQDAFAQCIGGLLSVVAQEVEIQVHSVSPGVLIKFIQSGRYRNTVDSFGGQHGVVYVGDVYADEEKQFMVYLSVPKVEDENNTLTTKLLEVKCSYKDPVLKEKILSETARAEIRRPLKEALSEEDKRVCLEVDRERNRILVAEGIAEAHDMAERGELDRACSLLENKKTTMLQSYAGQAGDAHTMSLLGQTVMMQQGMATKQKYVTGGRAFALSNSSSHMYQRAATQALHSHQPANIAPNSSDYCYSLSHQQSLGPQSGAPTSAPPGATAAFGSVFMGAPSVAAGFEADSGSPSMDAAPNAVGFGFQTPYMQQMVKKSQQERQSTG